MPIPNLVRKLRDSQTIYENDAELYEKLLIPEYSKFGWTIEPFEYQKVVSEDDKYYLETRLVEPSKLKCIVRGCDKRMFALNMKGKIYSTCPDHRITNGELSNTIFPLLNRIRISPYDAIGYCKQLGQELPIGLTKSTNYGGTIFNKVRRRF